MGSEHSYFCFDELVDGAKRAVITRGLWLEQMSQEQVFLAVVNSSGQQSADSVM